MALNGCTAEEKLSSKYINKCKLSLVNILKLSALHSASVRSADVENSFCVRSADVENSVLDLLRHVSCSQSNIINFRLQAIGVVVVYHVTIVASRNST